MSSVSNGYSVPAAYTFVVGGVVFVIGRGLGDMQFDF
jgi:hypothetical protein